MSNFYNKRHHHRGTLWGELFKSVIVENGETLINCLAYIDLNPIRAAIAKRPEDYRWCSLGYHIQTGNKDGFLSFNFGPVECASLSLRELNWASLKEFGTIYIQIPHPLLFGLGDRWNKRVCCKKLQTI
jgi:hypothetical protein